MGFRCTCDFKAAADNCKAVPVASAASAVREATSRGRGRLQRRRLWCRMSGARPVGVLILRPLVLVVDAKVLGEVAVKEALLLACAHHLQKSVSG